MAGPSHDEGRDLHDFVLAELRDRAGSALRKACTTLANHRDDLLAFARELGHELAAQFEVPLAPARQVLHPIAADPDRPDSWHREADLHRRSHGRLHGLRSAIAPLRQRTARASSVIENRNSRLRGDFFLGVGWARST